MRRHLRLQRRAVLVAMLGVAVACLLAFVPAHVETGDSRVGCGSFAFRDTRQLRRSFCDEKHIYLIRGLLIVGALGVSAVAAGALLLGPRKDADAAGAR